MKTFVGLFLSSAAFGLAVGIAYYLVAHAEAAGTTLLAVMTGALAFAASYAIVAERSARLVGDRPQVDPASAAGEDLGVYSSESPWPVLVALSALGALCGLLWSPFLLAVALAGMLLCFWRLGSESAAD